MTMLAPFRRAAPVAAVLIAALALTACGRKGPLQAIEPSEPTQEGRMEPALDREEQPAAARPATATGG